MGDFRVSFAVPFNLGAPEGIVLRRDMPATLTAMPKTSICEDNQLLPREVEIWTSSKTQACIADALYDVDSIVVDPGAYTKEELATLHSQILSNLEQAWEIGGGSEDRLAATMIQISQVGCFSGTVLGDACQLGCARVA